MIMHSAASDSGGNDGSTRLIGAGRAAPVQKKIGEYEISRLLGEGGMGTVLLARDPHLDRNVAIKCIRPELTGDSSFVERFMREARLVARLNHPNIVSVYQVGKHDGAPYLVMEYVEGHTLRDLLRTPPPLTVGQIIDYAAQCCDGLAVSSAAGIVHRDIKPANMMIRRDGLLKVMDFGLSKSLRGESHTATNATLGTPEFMSPEQSQGIDVDARTDIYALGISVFQCITGYLPFTGDSISAIAMKHLSEPLPRDSRLTAIGKGRLWNLVEAMTAKDPADRPNSYVEIRREFRAIADDLPRDSLHEATQIFATPTPPPRITTPSPRRTSGSGMQKPASSAGGRNRRTIRGVGIIGGGLVGLAAIAVGALALSGGIPSSANHSPVAAAKTPEAPVPSPGVPEATPLAPTRIAMVSRGNATWSDITQGLQAQGLSLIFDAGADPSAETVVFNLRANDADALLDAVLLATGWEKKSAGSMLRISAGKTNRCEQTAAAQKDHHGAYPLVTINTAGETRTVRDVAEGMRLSGGISYLIADRRLADMPVGKFAVTNQPLSEILDLIRQDGVPVQWAFANGILVLVPCR
ncbi:hypothetical protein BH09SUM1_BH09SUM1_24760 [soil metagenome]